MADTVVFLDANTLASPVTRTLLIAGGRADGLLLTWSAHVEAEADRHARGASSRTSVVRRAILGMELSKSARTTEGLLTTAPEDRQVIADAIRADAQYLVTTDVDDFAIEDLQAHEMCAVNPDYFMALRFSEHAYREGVRTLAEVAKNPPRSEAEVHSNGRSNWRPRGRSAHPTLTTMSNTTASTRPNQGRRPPARSGLAASSRELPPASDGSPPGHHGQPAADPRPPSRRAQVGTIWAQMGTNRGGTGW